MVKQTLFQFVIFSFMITKICAQSIPADFPTISTQIYDVSSLSDGKILISVATEVDNIGYYIMALENDGTPFFYKKIDNDRAIDFKQQPDGRLSYAQYLESLTYTGGGNVEHVVLDKDFNQVDIVQMKNGYLAEAHDFQYLPNGHYLMFGYYLHTVDLTGYKGEPDAQIAGTIIQELDADKNVVFQWRWYDHMQLEEADTDQFTRAISDPVHTNSIFMDTDGNIVMSCLSIGTIIKINRQTSEVMWKLGGIHNEFDFTNVDDEVAVGWFDGHDFRRLLNGNFSFFDNSDRNSEEISRVLEWNLNEENLTAELVWEYVPNNNVVGPFMGNAQFLPNNNVAIGWGSASVDGFPLMTEVNSNGDILLELFADEPIASYRSFRFSLDSEIPAKKYSEFGLVEGNSYTFGDTGVLIDVVQKEGEGYNELKIATFDYAPSSPQFADEPPLVYAQRVLMEFNFINSLSGNINFDVNSFNILNPAEIVIYHREFEGNGLFFPLNTTYNSAKNEITATFDQPGEFIFGYPYVSPIALPPYLVEPGNNEIVNQNVNVNLQWAPNGIVDEHELMVATDEEFNNLIFSESNLKSSVFEMTDLIANTTYYWKVRTEINGQVSEWSEVSIFTTSDDFLEITEPNGGEQWQIGMDQIIRWNDNIEDSVRIELLNEIDEVVQEIITKPSTGGLKWEVPIDFELGKYKVQISSIIGDQVDQSDNMFSIVAEVVSVSDKTSVEQPILFPNPTESLLYVSGLNSQPVFLKILDLRGNTVMRSNNSSEINVSSLQSGIYIMEINAINGIHRERFYKR